MKNIFRNLNLILFVWLIISATVSAQTGDTFEITNSVVSNGGGNSNGGNFGVTGTIAQPLAGTTSSNGQFAVRGGFWQIFFAPTAAMVSISGRVLQEKNNGIPRARILLTNGNGGTRTAVTNSFGYFRFDDVEVGQTYVISVRHKVYQFGNQTQVIFVGDEMTDIFFNALPE